MNNRIKVFFIQREDESFSPNDLIWGKKVIDYCREELDVFFQSVKFAPSFMEVANIKNLFHDILANKQENDFTLLLRPMPHLSVETFKGLLVGERIKEAILLPPGASLAEEKLKELLEIPFDMDFERRFIGQKIKAFHQQNGVVFIDPRHTYVDATVKIQAKTVIYPNCYLEGETIIGENCRLEPGSLIRDSILEDEVNILAYSYLEESIVKKKTVIGPFARLRPQAEVGENCKVGNFVEIKRAKLDQGVKIGHLSYVGDAHIGEKSNIGCGFITCNYDGVSKHETKIGKNVFLGSDSQTVAPVSIGDNSFIASGTTVTDNMPSDSFAISRGRQITKEKRAKI